MAHYAYLDDENIVITVIVGKNENELINGLEPEIYYALGTPFTVKRTSYNNKIRFNFASKGYTYDPISDAFIPPRPECGHDSLILNDKKQWECSECEKLIETHTL